MKRQKEMKAVPRVEIHVARHYQEEQSMNIREDAYKISGELRPGGFLFLFG